MQLTVWSVAALASFASGMPARTNEMATGLAACVTLANLGASRAAQETGAMMRHLGYVHPRQ
jgi:hypothetical protein